MPQPVQIGVILDGALAQEPIEFVARAISRVIPHSGHIATPPLPSSPAGHNDRPQASRREVILVAVIVPGNVTDQRAQRPRLVAVVERLFPRVCLTHVAAQRSGLRIARMAMHTARLIGPFL